MLRAHCYHYYYYFMLFVNSNRRFTLFFHHLSQNALIRIYSNSSDLLLVSTNRTSTTTTIMWCLCILSADKIKLNKINIKINIKISSKWLPVLGNNSKFHLLPEFPVDRVSLNEFKLNMLDSRHGRWFKWFREKCLQHWQLISNTVFTFTQTLCLTST